MSKKEEWPEGAFLSDMIILPLIKKGVVNGEEYITSFGYTCSKMMCKDGCLSYVAANIFRNLGWKHECERCGNFMIFGDIGKYVDIVGKYGKKIPLVRNYLSAYVTYKGKYGTEEGGSDLIKSRNDLIDFEDEE